MRYLCTIYKYKPFCNMLAYGPKGFAIVPKSVNWKWKIISGCSCSLRVEKMFHLIKALTVPSNDMTEVWMLVILRSKNNSLNKIQLHFKKSVNENLHSQLILEFLYNVVTVWWEKGKCHLFWIQVLRTLTLYIIIMLIWLLLTSERL